MRSFYESGIVGRRHSHIFFVTSRHGERVLSGFYRIKWYTKGPMGERDFCLAADVAHFVKEPIPLTVVDERCGTSISGRFRGMRLLTGAECRSMVRLLNAQVDIRTGYLQEIDRLERFNLLHGGYRYIGWKQSRPFSWEYAENYINTTGPTHTTAVNNSSSSGIWRCSGCGQQIKNKALLESAVCGCLGQLSPHET